MLDHKDFVTGLEDLKALRKQKADLEEQVKDTNADIESLVYDLVEYMETNKHESIKLEGIGLCSLTHTKKYSIDDPVIFEAWMRQQGDMDLVMAVHAQKVHGYYKEKLENNEELPPGIKTFVKSNISIRS